MADLLPARPERGEHAPGAREEQVAARTARAAAAVSGQRAARLRRRRAWRRRGTSAAVLLPLLAAVALAQGAGADAEPQRSLAEGQLVRPAWLWVAEGVAPAGRHALAQAQLGAHAALTGAFERGPSAVAGGREAALAAGLLAAALVWLVCRRLRLPLWAAAAAVVVAGASPLAVLHHRTVAPEALATPWVLAALALLLTHRPRVATTAAAAGLVLLAALTAPATLVLLPALAGVAWQHRPRTSRRTALLLVGAGLLPAAAAGLVALVTGPVPGAGETGRPLAAWWADDPVTVLLGAGAAAAGLRWTAVRPLAGGLLLAGAAAAVLALPAASAAPLTALAGVVVAATALAAAAPAGAGTAGRAGVVSVAATGVVAVVAVVAVAAAWVPGLRALGTGSGDAPVRAATGWVAENVPRGQRVLADDAVWVDLVLAGRTPGGAAQLAPGGAVPASWRDGDWLVVTAAVRRAGEDGEDGEDGGAGATAEALQRSVLVAAFGGDGPGGVQVRQLLATAPGPPSVAAPSAAARALATNPRLSLSDGAREVLVGRAVDERLVALLAQLASDEQLGVADLPQVPGEDAAGQPRRTVVLDGLAGRPLAAQPDEVEELRQLLAVQSEVFRPTTSVRQGPDGAQQLVIRMPVPVPGTAGDTQPAASALLP